MLEKTVNRSDQERNKRSKLDALLTDFNDKTLNKLKLLEAKKEPEAKKFMLMSEPLEELTRKLEELKQNFPEAEFLDALKQLEGLKNYYTSLMETYAEHLEKSQKE